MHWSPRLPENDALVSLKVFAFAPQIPKNSLASPQIPQNIGLRININFILMFEINTHSIKIFFEMLQ